LLVEDNEDLRQSLIDLLALVQVGCVAGASLRDVEQRAHEALACQLAILDINLGAGEPSGIAVHRWLRQQQFAGQIVFLTGHARSHPLVQEAMRLQGVRVLDKPIDFEALRQLCCGEDA
jgi:DNA-binding NtrC family response regulator